jgi:hypothetical protein
MIPGKLFWLLLRLLLVTLLHFIVLGGHTGHKTMQFMSGMVG